MPTFSPRSAGGGKCYVSGSGQRHSNRNDPTSPVEPVVDLDTYIDQEGNLEISLDTAKEIASVIGWIPAETAHGLVERRDEAETRIAELETQLADKQAVVDAFAGEIQASAKALAEAKELAWARGYDQACHDNDIVEQVGR